MEKKRFFNGNTTHHLVLHEDYETGGQIPFAKPTSLKNTEKFLFNIPQETGFKG